jgi:hypothetical protein
MCCSYDVRTVAVTGSAKGPKGWVNVDTARVYFDHPYHAQIDNALAIDFVNEKDGGVERVAVELSPDAARQLVKTILEALESGERELIAERQRALVAA